LLISENGSSQIGYMRVHCIKALQLLQWCQNAKKSLGFKCFLQSPNGNRLEEINAQICQTVEQGSLRKDLVTALK
jgi:hypothetical protein